RIFTEDYLSKAWHALAGVRMGTGGEGLVGLMIDPTNQSMCKVVFWPSQSVLSSPQSGIVETAPAAAVLPSANALGALALVTNRIWDAEGNASTPFLQFQLFGSTNWSNATITKLDGATYTTSTRVSALPGGVN